MNWKEKVFNLTNLDEFIKNKLQTYVDLLLKQNQKMNLTKFNEITIWNEGIYQSIVLLDTMLKNQNNFYLLDIGAGAGFPSIPYLIYKKNSFKLTIVESNKKRIEFLNEIKNKLNLDIELINNRIEELNIEEKFDYVTARAVTSLKNLIEISSKAGKINSTYFFLKSKKYQEEIEKSKNIINILNINNIKIKKINLNDEKEHVIVYYLKNKKTPPNFPRKWSTIIKEN